MNRRLQLVAAVTLVGAIVAAAWVVSRDRGPCPSAAQVRAFWAREAGSTSDANREEAIDDQLRCLTVLGEDSGSVRTLFGEPDRGWQESGDPAYLIYSQGGVGAGIYVQFDRPGGPATLFERWEPDSE